VISLSASINSRTPETIKEKLEEEEEKNGWLLSHRREFLTCPTMSNGDGWEKEKTLPFFSYFLFYFFGDVVKGSGRQWMDIFDRYGRETSSQIGMHPS
jgi:hypothetical protein